MKYRVLNFPDAMKLAQILSQHLDTVSIKEMTGKEFGYFVFDVLEQEEVPLVINLLLGEENVPKSPKDIIFACVDSMVGNNILELLDFYKGSLNGNS